MPAIVEIRFATLAHPDAPVTSRQTHAALMAALDEPPATHHDGNKPYSCWPLMDDPDQPGGLVLRVGWLGEGEPPRGLVDPSGAWRFGRLGAHVRSVRVSGRTFGEMLADPPAAEVRFEFISPMHFSRSGVSYPLPEPKLLIDGLARRWNHHSPHPLNVGENCWRELSIVDLELHMEALLVSGGGAPRTGSGARVPEVSVSGAVGHLVLRPTTSAAAATLTVLGQFAEFSGVGHLTTQGFGACAVRGRGGQWRERKGGGPAAARRGA